MTSRLNCDGGMLFSARNWRLKLDRLLKPTSKQMSEICARSSLMSIWQAKLMRSRRMYWRSDMPVCLRNEREKALGHGVAKLAVARQIR